MGSIPEPAVTDTMVPPRDLTSEMDFATRYRLRCNTAIVMDFLDLALLAYCTHAQSGNFCEQMACFPASSFGQLFQILLLFSHCTSNVNL